MCLCQGQHHSLSVAFICYSSEYMKSASLFNRHLFYTTTGWKKINISNVFLLLGFFFSISCFSGSIKMCQWMINPRHSLLQCQWDLLTESLHCHSHIRTIFGILIYPTCPNQGQDFWMKCDRESFAGLFSVGETSQRQKSWSCYIRSFQVMLLLFFNELLPANTCCTF